jgi:hypothetical protein
VPDTDATVDAAETENPSAIQRWLPIATLAIALIAVVLAIVGWFRPWSGPPSYSDSQSNDAKTQMCVAFLEVNKGVVTNTHRVNPQQGNAGSALAVMANARLALYGGGAYLKDRLASLPATPGDLAKAITSAANTMEQLSIGYLAEAPEATVQPLRTNLNNSLAEAQKLCK